MTECEDCGCELAEYERPIGYSPMTGTRFKVWKQCPYCGWSGKPRAYRGPEPSFEKESMDAIDRQAFGDD